MTIDPMSDDKALAPCPFCGGKAEIRPNQIGDYFVICYADEPDQYACGASSSDVNCETPEKAVRRWNTRHQAALPKPLESDADVEIHRLRMEVGDLQQARITYLSWFSAQRERADKAEAQLSTLRRDTVAECAKMARATGERYRRGISQQVAEAIATDILALSPSTEQETT